MASAAFPSSNLILDGGGGGGREKFIPSRGLDHMEFDPGKLVDEDFLFSNNQQQEHHSEQISFIDHVLLDDLMFDPVESRPVKTCFKKAAGARDHRNEGIEHKKERHPISMASLGLLTSYRNGIKKLEGDRIIKPGSERESNDSAGGRLSIDGMVRLAGAKFIQPLSPTADLLPVLGPFRLAFSDLSNEEKREVQLVEPLLVCAEKVSYLQLDRARNLLNQSSSLFLDRGTPVQRLVYYFADALLERIDRVTGRVASEDSWKIRELTHDLSVMNPNRSRISCHQETPFSQIGQLTAIQAIVENVAGAKIVHAVDLSIGSGAQWAIMMQALQNSELELLKTTAIGTLSQHLIEETGRGLESFAGEMNLRISFRLVMVDELLTTHLREDHLEVESAETVVVYSQYFLRTLTVRPDRLDALMRAAVKIGPSLMVVTEVEANHNSPSFMDRFIETLFFYGAYFDCLESCMERLDENRLLLLKLELVSRISD